MTFFFFSIFHYFFHSFTLSFFTFLFFFVPFIIITIIANTIQDILCFICLLILSIAYTGSLLYFHNRFKSSTSCSFSVSNNEFFNSFHNPQNTGCVRNKVEMLIPEKMENNNYQSPPHLLCYVHVVIINIKPPLSIYNTAQRFERRTLTSQTGQCQVAKSTNNSTR